MPKQQSTLTPELLAAALEGLETQRKQIDAQIAEVRRMLGSRPASNDGSVATPHKRTMSPAAKARIAAAQRKRWAEFHNEQAMAPRKKPGKAAAGKEATAAAQPRKRRLSAEGRRRIIEAAKKRWAAVKGAAKAK